MREDRERIVYFAEHFPGIEGFLREDQRNNFEVPDAGGVIGVCVVSLSQMTVSPARMTFLRLRSFMTSGKSLLSWGDQHGPERPPEPGRDTQPPASI